MDIFNTYIIDDLLFLFSSFIIIVYFFKKKIKTKEKIVYSFLFIIFNSSFNSHFVSVTNYNLVTLRTFIWSFKFFWKFTFLDFVCIFIVLINLMKIPIILKKSKILKIAFVGDFALLIMGTISYLLWKSYSIDSFANYIICFKAFVYALAFMILLFKYLNTPVNIIKPMFLILFFGFISMGCTPISVGIKIRYGMISVVSDQEDMNTILLFSVIYLIIYFLIKILNHKLVINSNTIITLLMAFFLGVQLILCFSKAAIFLFAISIVLFLYFYNRKTTKLIFTCFCLLPVAVFLLKDKMIELFTSEAINTRFYQFYDCIDYMRTLGPFANMIGVGVGGPYYSTRVTNDLGEIKTIDLNQYGLNWKFSLQTPIISVFKDVGFIGMFIFLFNRIYLITYLSKIIRKETSITDSSNLNVEIISIILFLIPTCLTVYFFHSTMLPVIIFNIFLICRLEICLKEKKLKKESVCVE